MRAARISAGRGFDEGPFGPRFGWLLTLKPVGLRGPRAPDTIDKAGVSLRLLDRFGTRKGLAFVAVLAINTPDEAALFGVELDVGVDRSVPVFVIDGDAERKK